ncbi:MAG: Fe-S cluster assembly protein SufD, partial [Armatimonadota bacterium]|nr:Fe-S cluster assembly protein SufD [Armatimonadota bacterium]
MSGAVVRDLSEVWAEPEWLQRYRTRALRAFEALPLPEPTEEAWRRTPPEWLFRGDLLPAVEKAGTGSLPPEVTDALAVEVDRSGTVVNGNGAPLL